MSNLTCHLILFINIIVKSYFPPILKSNRGGCGESWHLLPPAVISRAIWIGDAQHETDEVLHNDGSTGSYNSDAIGQLPVTL